MRRPLLAAWTGLAVALTTALGPAAVAAPATDDAPTDAGAVAPVAGIAPRDKVLPGMADAEGTVTAFVRLAVPSAVDVAATGAGPATVAAAEDRIEDVVDSVVPEAGPSAAGADAGGGDDGDGGGGGGGGSTLQRISVTTAVVAGTVVRGDAADLRALAGSPHVAGVYRVGSHRPTNAGADLVTRAVETWRSTGHTGAGVRIGIVDTGVDYTHATFGGPGTPEAYARAYGGDGTGPVPEGVVDPAKYLGGVDLAGPRYDARGITGSDQPVPDGNPIDPPHTADSPGHGTHVAGTAAGYGVQADGTTFRGDHAGLTDLTGWRVAPGAAPGAGVYALKVFGDAGGTTDLLLAAMDRAADPDGDGDFSDRLDVLAVSLGTDGAPADAPENLFVDELADLGVLTVTSVGNAGDVTDVGAVPGSARSGLTVAWSVGGTLTVDAVEVTEADDAALLGRYAAQASVSYAGTADVTAPVTFLGPEVTGCTPLSEYADRLRGTIAYLSWDDDPSTRECGSAVRWDNADDAGAVGVLLGTELATFPGAVGGNAAIPGAQLTAAATDALLPHIRDGRISVRLGPSLRGAAQTRDDVLADTLSPASSRGAHGSLGVVKPDVAAPGQQILSAASGTGSGAHLRSGSSMAAAHVAGTAALVRAARPGWTPGQVKAAVMNTATQDVRAGSSAGPVHGPTRVGSGRVDALDAVGTTTLAYATQDPDLVSVAWGVVPVGEHVAVRRRTVTVENHGTAPVRYRTGFDAATTAGGATVTAVPEVVDVAPGGRGLITLTLSADPATLARDPDPTSAPDARLGDRTFPREHVAALGGRLVLRLEDATSDGRTGSPATELRVPVHAAPRPVSELTARPPTFDAPGTAATSLVLDGRAVRTGGWTSHVAAMALARTSPRLEPTDVRVAASVVDAGDIRQVGFLSTAPALRAAGRDPSDGVIGIGIATQGEWASLGTAVRPAVDIDVDGDGSHDFRAVVAKASSGADLTTVHLLDATDAPVDEVPLGHVAGDGGATVFDSNVVVVPVPVAALGLVPGQRPTFTVWTYSEHAADPAGVVDRVEPFTADPFAPEYWVEGPAPDALLVPATTDAPVTLHRTAGTGTPAADLLVLHTHNATPAARAQVLDVRAPVAGPTTTTLDVAGDLQVGGDVGLTATVQPVGATGTVTFRTADGEVGAAEVVAGTATTTVRLRAGLHRLTAEFVPGSTGWQASTSDAVVVGVARATSSTSLRISDRAITFGGLSRATVRVVAAAGSPSGTVELRAGGTVLATGELVTAGRRGTARIDLPRDLPVAAHRLRAVYVGGDDVAGSRSAPVRVRVTAATPDVVLAAPSWTVAPGAEPTITVTVGGRAGAPVPTGVVTVLLDLRRVDSARLGPDGSVDVTLPAVRDRALVTVLYGGDAGHRPAVKVRTLRVR